MQALKLTETEQVSGGIFGIDDGLFLAGFAIGYAIGYAIGSIGK